MVCRFRRPCLRALVSSSAQQAIGPVFAVGSPEIDAETGHTRKCATVRPTLTICSATVTVLGRRRRVRKSYATVRRGTAI